MKRLILTATVLLAACSNEPVGQSAYFDPWENPQLPQEQDPRVSQEVALLNSQVEAKRLENARQIAVQNGDAALVASLEAAIASAGPNATPTALPNPVEVSGTPAPLPVGATTAQVQPQVMPVAPETRQGTAQISDNSFQRVVQTETIETDAARLAAQQQASVVLQAEPLPDRNDGINLAAFALSTNHNIGARLYPRVSRSSASQRCRKYGNPDAAQRAFLAAGGPEKDDLRLDPDGDGFVCGWTPIPFRNLKVGG